MNCSVFATLLENAILTELEKFARLHSADRPYAFALIGGQCRSYLGYAIASETGLQRVAAEYDQIGYRYQGWSWENFDNCEKLAIWLRWSTPDDGWQYGDFSEPVQKAFAQLVGSRLLGENADELEPFCTAALTSLTQEPKWHPWSSVTVGFSYGEDPRDFLRTATRANPHAPVLKLWAESSRGEGLDRRILPPKL